MKNRYFLLIVLVCFAGLVAAIIESTNRINHSQSSYSGMNIPAELFQKNQQKDFNSIENQQAIFNPEIIQQNNQSEEGFSFPLGDSAFDIMSIPDPQLRALLSGNMPAQEKKQAENKENNFTKPEPVSKPIALYTGEERTFGYLPQKPVHNPADEFFYLEVKDILNSNSEVYLEYDLYGVEDNTQVSRSINDQPVFGGYVVKQHQGWSKQSELINPDLLKPGINTIRFSIAENVKYSYTVKNVQFRIAEQGKSTPDNNPSKAIVVKSKKNNEIRMENGELTETENDRRLIVNQPTTAYYYRRFGYVQGFVTGEGYEKAQIRIGGQKVRIFKGEFESMISRNSQGEEVEADDNVLPSYAPWSTTVEAIFPDGEIISLDITFEKPAQWDFLTGFDANIHHAEKATKQDEDFMLTLGAATLYGEAGSLQENTNLSITALRAIDLPKLNPGMVNVTASYDGYRFLPHGSNFDKPLNITIGFDSTKLPRGHYPQEVRTYYYDENRSHWVALPRDSVNKGDYLVCSRTTHFTDMINAIVKAPEMPETQEYTPTSLKELQAADPSSGIQMMQPPTANSQGTATLSYPINVPAGRQGMQPNLAVSYSSEVANGLLGMGWDMNIPAITVDTKWGSPRYDPANETETYSLNGEELLPSARRSVNWEARNVNTSGGTKLFYPLVESNFEKIERKGGTSPKYFFWIVTDKQGIKYYYGTYNGTSATSTLLKDKNGNIAHWPLCKVIDLNGNYIQYNYEIKEQFDNSQYSNVIKDPIYLGQQLWLNDITYTGYGGNEGAYKVVFCSDDCDLGTGADRLQAYSSTQIPMIDQSLNEEDSTEDPVIQRSGAAGSSVLINIGAVNSNNKTQKIPNSRISIYEYDANNTKQLIQTCTTGSNGLSAITVIENKKYCAIGTYFGSSYQGTPVEFDFEVKSALGKIEITRVSGLLRAPTDTIITQYNSSSLSGEILMPVVPISTPPSGVTLYVRLFWCSQTVENMIKVPVQFRLSKHLYGNTYTEVGYYSSDITQGHLALGVTTGTKYKLEQVTLIPGQTSLDELVSVEFTPLSSWWMSISQSTNNGHKVFGMFRMIEIDYTPKKPYDLKVVSSSNSNTGLSGAIFHLYDNDYLMQTCTTDASGYIRNLPLQSCATYHLVQTKVPDGYSTSGIPTARLYFGHQTANISHSSHVEIDQEAKLITVKNSPAGSTPNNNYLVSLRVRVVSTSGEGISQFPFQVHEYNSYQGLYETDKDGYTLPITVGIGNYYSIKEIDKSTYSPLSGMINMTVEQINQNLSATGLPSNATLTMENSDPKTWLITIPLSKKTTLLNIYKREKNSNTLLMGSRFRIYHYDIDGWTTHSASQGSTGVIGLKTCTQYMIKEDVAPSGYQVDPNPIVLYIDNSGKVKIVSSLVTCQLSQQSQGSAILTVFNEKQAPNVKIKKVDEDNRSLPIEDAGFVVYKFPNLLEPVSISRTNAEGLTHSIPLSINDTFRIEEYSTPDGYSTYKNTFVDLYVNSSGAIVVLNSSQTLSPAQLVDGSWIYVLTNKKETYITDLSEPPTYDDCQAMYPYDKTINARSGFRQSSKEKLRKIIIYYNGNIVRSYSFCYATDAFGRAQLREIEQWGTSYEEPAYVHKMEYYDDVRPNGFSNGYKYLQDEETWNVSGNDLSIDLNHSSWKNKSSKKLGGLFEKPTVLGGSQTLSIGGGASANVGIGFNSISKDLAVSYSGSGSGSFSKGRATLMDVDGDGLPDKVYTKGKQIYYEPQLAGQNSFGEAKMLNGVQYFLREKSSSYSHGPQGSFFVYGGIQWGKTTSTTRVYLTDLNGDGFPDIVNDGKVSILGRTISPPSFSFSGCMPPTISQEIGEVTTDCSDIMEGLDDIGIPEEDTVEDILQYDVVRVWKASFDVRGESIYHRIFAPVQLEEDSATAIDFCGEEDAVIVSIEMYGEYAHNGDIRGIPTFQHLLLWSDTLWAGDTRIHCEDSSWRYYGDATNSNVCLSGIQDPLDMAGRGLNFLSMPLFKDAMLFFRVRPLNNGVKAKVKWDPQVFNTMNRYLPYLPKVDADRLMVGNGEKASKSQLRHGDSKFYCPFSGTIQLLYQQNIPVASDITTYEVYHNNVLIASHNLNSGASSLNKNITFAVRENDSLEFIVKSRTNVDLVSRQWRPELHYQTVIMDGNTQEPVSAIDEGESFLSFYPSVHYTFFTDIAVPSLVHARYFGAKKIVVQPSMLLLPGQKLTGKVVFALKRKGATLYTKEYNFVNQSEFFLEATPAEITIPTANLADSIYLECYIYDRRQAQKIKYCYFKINNSYLNCVVYAPEKSHAVFGTLYRGWGQFLYQHDDLPKMDAEKFKYMENLKNNKIKMESIMDTSQLSVGSLDEVHTLADKGSDAFASKYKMILQAFPMSPDNENLGHVGLYANTWVRGAYINLGGIPCYQDEEEEDPCGEQQVQTQSASVNNSQTNVIARKIEGTNTIMRSGSSSYGGYGIDKITKSTNKTWSYGVSAGMIGQGTTGGDVTTTVLTDLMDLNGDGYPDVLKSGYVQYSKPYNGSLEGSRMVFNAGAHHQSITTSNSANFNGAFIDTEKSPSSSAKGKSFISQTGPTTGGSVSEATDETLFTLMDINGDGLPDRINNEGKVWLNLGNGFEEGDGEQWHYIQDIGSRTSTSLSASAGGTGSASFGEVLEVKDKAGKIKQFNKWSTSIGGGINISAAENKTKVVYADVNGDGLPDMIVNMNPLRVRLNNGAGFDNHLLTWHQSMPDFAWNNVITAGINGSGTLGVSIPIFFFVLKINGTVDINAGMSVSKENVQLMDIDGDGVTDVLVSANENDLRVKKSNIGRSGLLRAVTNPLGGSYEIAYHRTPSSVSHSRRWVMDTVIIRDNFPGDGADIMMTTYNYEHGYYDRTERSFYGFAKVTEKQRDTENNNAIYRTITRYYHNNSIYLKGLPLAEVLKDAQGNMFTFTKNDYELKSARHTSSRFPALAYTKTCYFEGQQYAGIEKEQWFTYDSYGNVKTKKETSTSMPTLTITIDYHVNTTNYIVGIPSRVNASNLRKRETVIDAKGRITQVKDYYNFTQFLSTTMQYENTYGNCTLVTYTGGSYYRYQYETDLNTYPIRVTDAFGNYSRSENYDYRFGIPLNVYDKSGNRMKYELDNWGRIRSITGPKELASNSSYTIRYEYIRGNYTRLYNPIQKKYITTIISPYSSRTYNYDPANPGNDIEVYTYSDGLGRIIQTKKDAEVNGSEVMIVSGHTKYDAFGRVVESRYPTENHTSNTTYSTAIDWVNPSTTYYDILDRPTLQRAPDNTETNYNYEFGSDDRGHSLFLTRVTDPNGNESMVLKDVNGLQYGLQAAGQPWVYFEYNPVGDCVQTYGENWEFERQYQSDMLGRKVWYKEGELEEYYHYGNSPNLINHEIAWSNPHHGYQSKSNSYTYDRNRLMYAQSSDYNYPIEYEYDNKGKLMTIRDESGSQHFEYGNMGEVTRMIRNYAFPDHNLHPFGIETRFNYDSWGRIADITYPDGENVQYYYDKGGMLKSMQGEKAGHNYEYINNIVYNKFGTKSYILYGNGTDVYYTYDQYNQRLANQSGTYIHTYYDYDNTGNITWMYSNHFWRPWGGGIEQNFSYDASNQLVNANGNDHHHGTIYDLNVGYDPYGKIRDYDVHMTDFQTGHNSHRYNYFQYHNPGNSTSFAPTDGYIDLDVGGHYSFSSPQEYFYGINGSMREKRTHYDQHGYQRSEYYLFNSFNQMKVYSDNGETYGYYGYDAGGERTYKIQFSNMHNQVNSMGDPKYLIADKITFYPNGYININQDGNYTKHYYADDQRVVSKIGSGFMYENGYNSCDGIWEYDPGDLNHKKNIQYEVMIEELNRVTDPEEQYGHTVHSLDMHHRGDFCNINNHDPNHPEDERFFYYGNHLSSTQVVTDMHGNVVQGVLYAPFGEVISEYNSYWHNGLIPDYTFNGKELDEESGMYYYSARYYAPPTFISRDPLFEKYPHISPYAYCANNPVKYIDPTGMEFDPAAKEVATNFLAETNDKISTITNEMNTLKKNGGSGSDYYKGLETQLGELNAAINEVIALEADKNSIYSINFTTLPGDVPGAPVSNKAAGNITYNGTNSRDQNKITINIKGTAKNTLSIQAHEFKHAHQYLEGRLGWYFDANTGKYEGNSNNQVFEKEAGFRQSMYNGTYSYGNTVSNYSFGDDSDYNRLESFDLYPSSYKGYAKSKGWNFVTGR